MTRAKRDILNLSNQLVHYAKECELLSKKSRLDSDHPWVGSKTAEYCEGQADTLLYAATRLKMIADKMR